MCSSKRVFFFAGFMHLCWCPKVSGVTTRTFNVHYPTIGPLLAAHLRSHSRRTTREALTRGHHRRSLPDLGPIEGARDGGGGLDYL